MSQEDIRGLDYWSNRWKEGRTGWHCSETNQFLTDHVHLFLPFPDKYKVFVPLCGKSLDLLWLYKEGHHVVGVEAVEDVVIEFLTEHKFDYDVTKFPFGKLFQTSDKRLQIYACDLFELPSQQVGRVGAVWDRGSLVAINVSQREKYANFMKKVLLPRFRYLLATFDYTPNEKFSGPPCSVPVSQVHKLFGDMAQWQLLTTVEASHEARFVNNDITKASQCLILLTQKN